jgi:hypothetical protein
MQKLKTLFFFQASTKSNDQEMSNSSITPFFHVFQHPVHLSLLALQKAKMGLTDSVSPVLM